MLRHKHTILTLALGSRSVREMTKSLGRPPTYTPVLLPMIVPVAQSLDWVPVSSNVVSLSDQGFFAGDYINSNLEKVSFSFDD